MTLLAHRFIARTLPPDVAEYVIGDLVERDVRGVALWREAFTAAWSMSDHAATGDDLVTSFIADLRYAARLLMRAPVFTLVCVVTLGLGIGATTAIFSVINPVIIEPLPYADPGRLAMVWERGRDGARGNLGFATIRDLRDQSPSIASAAAIGSWLPTIDGSNGPERVRGDRVSWNYFRTLGVSPALGRDFTREEDAPGNYLVVILSHGLWARSFGADSGIIGRLIKVGGMPMTVVGIMPAGFQNVVSPGAQIWRVLGYDTQAWACRTCRHLRMIARFKPDVSFQRAGVELDASFARIERAFPDDYESAGAVVVGVKAEMTRQYRPALFALAGAVAALLLIAIANVSSMVLARAVRREEEFAVRTALGAGRGRLTRQLLAESLLLAALGGVAGVVVAAAAVPLLVSQLPPDIPRLSEARLNGTALAVAAAIILLATIAAGMIPAAGRRITAIADTLRSGRRTSGGRQLARSGLVVAEVALAMMLLVGCGLLARSVVGLLDVNPGFNPANLLTLEVNSVGSQYDSAYKVYAYHDRVREAVSRVPGVVTVGMGSQIPLGGNMDQYGVFALDKPGSNPEDSPSAERYAVSGDYLRAMGIRLVAGRDFSTQELADTSGRVVIVSEALARALWPGEDPLGRPVRVGGGEDAPPRRVIGVVGNIRHAGLDATFPLQVYVPQTQWGPENQVTLVVRTEGDPTAHASTIRRAVREIDETQPVFRVASMDELISSTMSQRRLALALFAVFAGVALLLAVAGIYGVLAGRVAERTREIGLRSALGATPADILALVVGQGARLTAVGLAVGVGGALLLSRFLQALLFGISPQDPLTLMGVIVLLAGVTLAACILPGVRALRIGPAEALRSE